MIPGNPGKSFMAFMEVMSADMIKAMRQCGKRRTEHFFNQICL